MSVTGRDPSPVLRVGVVLVAAGRGERLGGALPKQFQSLGGRPLVAWSLDLFDALPGVTRIVLALPAAGAPAAVQPHLVTRRAPLTLVTGGGRRQDSVAAGLAALDEAFDVALVHDAARPFAEPEAIDRLVTAAMAHGGGLLAARCADTVKRATPAGQVAETLDRERIWLAQTPQAIRADYVPRAIEALRRPDLNVTDEAGLLEQWGIGVALVESSPNNFKITTPWDLERAEALLRHRGSAVDVSI